MKLNTTPRLHPHSFGHREQSAPSCPFGRSVRSMNLKYLRHDIQCRLVLGTRDIQMAFRPSPKSKYLKSTPQYQNQLSNSDYFLRPLRAECQSRLAAALVIPLYFIKCFTFRCSNRLLAQYRCRAGPLLAPGCFERGAPFDALFLLLAMIFLARAASELSCGPPFCFLAMTTPWCYATSSFIASCCVGHDVARLLCHGQLQKTEHFIAPVYSEMILLWCKRGNFTQPSV